MPPALSVMGPKVSIARIYAQLISIPIVATAVPKIPPGLITWGMLGSKIVTWLPKKKESPKAAEIARTGRATHSNPTAKPVIIVVAEPVRDAETISRTGRQVPAV